MKMNVYPLALVDKWEVLSVIFSGVMIGAYGIRGQISL